MSGARFQALLGTPPSIGVPVSLGGATGGSAVTSVTLTTLAAIPAGALVVVGVLFNKAATGSVSSVSDGTNTYSLAQASTWTANNDIEELWYCPNALPVGSGASLVATLSGTSVGTPLIAAAYVTGVALSSPLDGHNATKYAPATAFNSGATATLAQAKEIAFGFAGFYNAAATVTEGSGFTLLVDQVPGGSPFFHGHLAYQIVTATTALNYQPVLSASNFGGSIIATFKGQ